MRAAAVGAALLLLLFVAPANAQQDYPRDLTLRFTMPTEYVNGTLIEAGVLRGALCTCWRSNDPNALVIDQEVPAPDPGVAYTHTFFGLIPQPGTYICGVYAVTVDDLYSDMSNTVDRKYTGKPRPPNPITIVVD